MSSRPPRRRRRPPQPADADLAITPSAGAASKVAPGGSAEGDALDAAILRFLRLFPNRFVDLAPLADELGIDPFKLQLSVERLAGRRLLNAPFIEPGTAGGGELTQAGLRWLIRHEGGQPQDVPAALQPATDRVRAEDEAARLPRAQVYGSR